MKRILLEGMLAISIVSFPTSCKDKPEGEFPSTEKDLSWKAAATTMQSSAPDVKYVKGDTTAKNAGTPAATPCPPEDLERLNRQIWDIREKLGRENPLFFNFHGSYTTKDSLIVNLAINTPYWQALFRQQISDSPRIGFQGPTTPQKIDIQITSDKGVRLQPDSAVFPTNAESASFTLCNLSQGVLQFGKRYVVGYQDTDGQWYALPHIGTWEDIGYALRGGGTHTFKAALLPKLNRNRPGTYRLYKEVYWANGRKDRFWIMTEFRLK